MFDSDQVSSPIEAYLLGFLYADGYITSKRKDQYYILGIGLAEKDKDFLQGLVNIFNEALNSNYALSYDSKTKAYKVAIGNIELIQHLQKLGLVADKSYDKSDFVFTNIPDSYKKDFLLGLWDGDGSFTSDNSDRHRNLAGLISNNDNLLIAIVEYINSQLGEGFCHLKDRTPGDPYPRIRFTDNKAKIFGDWLYQNAVPLRMQRKYEAYLKFKPIHGKGRSGLENAGARGVICLDNGNIYATAKDCCMGEFGIENPGAVNCIRSVCRGEGLQTRGKHFRYLTPQEKESYIKNGSI